MKPSQTPSAFRSQFARPHVVLPVIHVETESQAERNVRMALDEGVEGLFLINHGLESQALLQIHASMASLFPDAWMGVNCLDLSPVEVCQTITERVNGVWVDNAMIDETGKDNAKAQHVLDVRNSIGRNALYFGGVAFKYQRQIDDISSAAQIAAGLMDVVTTSGAGTGHAAHLDKVRVMKEAIGDFPLAIASGITPENIDDYLPYSDCYLVATGISSSFTELDRDRLRKLIQRVRHYDRVAS